MKRLQILILLLSATLGLGVSAYSRQNDAQDSFFDSYAASVDTSTPRCMSQGRVLSYMNDQALQWKATKNSGFQARALISGTVDEVFADRSGHRHFSIKIGPKNDDHIEVVYNESFGAMPTPQDGDSVEACGDFIVATQQNGEYPPSPDGAIIHWVHKHTRGAHDDGFVLLNNVLYGFGNDSRNQK